MRTLTLILTGPMVALTALAASVPRPSPELTMQRGGATPIKLSQFRGKIMTLVLAQTTWDNCQFLPRTLKVIQKDYAARNVQVVECAFEEDVSTNYPMFLKAFAPNFPTGYTTDDAVKKYLQWNNLRDGPLMVPYLIIIDARGIVRGDFSGKDGFFTDADKRIRGRGDHSIKSAAKRWEERRGEK